MARTSSSCHFCNACTKAWAPSVATIGMMSDNEKDAAMITYDFSEKVVVVTGSARGIGRRIAERFYAAGAKVALCSISKTGKEELMQECRR